MLQDNEPTSAIRKRVPYDGSKVVYIERRVLGDRLSVEIYEGRIQAVSCWIGDLCHATPDQIQAIIEWLEEIKKAVEATK